MYNASALTTKRLFLRPVELGDAASTAALMSPAIAAKLMTWPDRMGEVEARRRIARSRREAEAGRWINWGVFSKEDLVLMGWVGLGRSDLDATRIVIGYWVGEAFQRRGFGTEAVAAMLDRWSGLFGEGDIDAYVSPDNVASAKLLRGLGFAQKGLQRRYVDARVRWEDFLHFCLPQAAIRTTSTPYAAADAFRFVPQQAR